MKLNNLTIKAAQPKEKTYRLYDGHGLYLEIRPNGGKYWYVKYRFGGKEKRLSAGTYPSTKLADARYQARDVKQKLANNIDPVAERKLKKLVGELGNANTFFLIAEEWFQVKIADKSASHQKRTKRLLVGSLYPYIGDRPIAAITTPEMLAALRKTEDKGIQDTAIRARGVANQVFRYAIQTGRAENNPAESLRGALKSHKKTHYAAITEPELLGNILVSIDESPSGFVVKTATQLTPILFQRPGEIRHMEWSEIDFEKRMWSIPADKMKMQRDHLIPLPTQAIELLKQIHRLTGRGKYVFPSNRGASRCISENAVRVALRDMGYDNSVVTPHGFRATARTLLDEVLEFPTSWIEHQLAHAVKDTNGRAYNRTRHIKQRIEMMQRWADYLDKLKEAARQKITAKPPEPYNRPVRQPTDNL